MKGNELIMNLTREQGKGRESQVQPPIEVWEQFFGFRTTTRPTFRLQNQKRASDPEQRKVVKHHHNFTLEIGDAKPPRPAILRIKKAGRNSYFYWVYRPPSKEYAHCDWILKNMADKTVKDRTWVVI